MNRALKTGEPLDQRELRFRVSQIRDIPPLSGALQKLLQIIHEEAGSQKELESVIHLDQALSAKVLKAANSAYYGMRGEIFTLSRAIMVMGFDQAKSLCLCTLLLHLCSKQAPLESSQREKLWKHAFATARIASEIARKRPWISVEKAYVLGLLHDIGRIVLATHFKEHYKAISSIAERKKLPDWYVELQYGLNHATIGKWIAIKWALPEVFQSVIEFHHTPEKCASSRAEAHMIALADILAHAQDDPGPVNDEVTLSHCRELCITEEEWSEHQERMSRIWPEVDQFWTLLN